MGVEGKMKAQRGVRLLVQSRSSFASAPLLDFRRISQRKGWKTYHNEEDQDIILWPNESHARNYVLNWTFNRYQVTPTEFAYRNLHLRGLQMLVPSETDQNKTVRVNLESSSHPVYFLASESAPQGAATVDSRIFKAVSKEIKLQLSQQKELFMHDGAINSSPSAQLKARLMFNGSLPALYLHHLLHPIPKIEPDQFAHDVTGWMLQTNSFRVPLAEAGISSQNFTIIDQDNNSMLVVGQLSPVAVQNSLLELSGNHFLNQQGLVLNCDAIYSPQSNKSALVFYSGNVARPANMQNLFASEHTVWTESGLSALWDSASSAEVPTNAKRGDLVIQQGKNIQHVSKFSRFANSVNSPSTVVVVSDGSAKVGKKVDAKTLLSSCANGLSSATNSPQYVELLDKQLQSTTVKVVQAKQKSAQEIQSALVQLLKE